MTAGQKPTPAVRSLDRGLNILAGLTVNGASLTELAHEAQLPLPTATRLLETARASGFVTRGADGRYRAGPGLLSLAYHFGRDEILHRTIRDALVRLRNEVNETVSFDVRNEDQRTSVEAVESDQSVRRSHPIGISRPFHTGAAGKVFLAFGDTEGLLALVPEKAEPADGTARASHDRLRAVCAQVREAGYSYAPMEIDKEAWGLAAPVFIGPDMVGVLAVSGPVTRSSEHHIDRCIAACLRTAAALSERLSSVFRQPLTYPAGEAGSPGGTPAPSENGASGARRSVRRGARTTG